MLEPQILHELTQLLAFINKNKMSCFPLIPIHLLLILIFKVKCALCNMHPANLHFALHAPHTPYLVTCNLQSVFYTLPTYTLTRTISDWNLFHLTEVPLWKVNWGSHISDIMLLPISSVSYKASCYPNRPLTYYPATFKTINLHH